MKKKKLTKTKLDNFIEVIDYMSKNKDYISVKYTDLEVLKIKPELSNIIEKIEAYAKLNYQVGYDEAKDKYEEILFGGVKKKPKTSLKLVRKKTND